MQLGYSTNSIGDIAPLDALPILRDLGYESLAITPDRHLLDPFSSSFAAETSRWRSALATHGLACVIETGARHLLDPLHKHEPTLVSPHRADRDRRVEFLVRAIDLAVELGAPVVSLWSGAARDAADEDTLWQRLTAALGPVLDRAAARGVTLGFEPEPGMFIDTLARQASLHERLSRPAHFKLTVDLGHLECMGEKPAASLVARRAADIVNVHVDDMLACRHEHLPLGAGDVDFPPLLAALAAAGYAGGLHVELPRQSHRWLETARASAAFLQACTPA
ncbi:MAG: sugar phosphate isomerase/epimerase family protein [Planctomycetia bacterium]